jgi:hypothetical protein
VTLMLLIYAPVATAGIIAGIAHKIRHAHPAHKRTTPRTETTR